MKRPNVHLAWLGWLTPSFLAIAGILWFIGTLESSSGNPTAWQIDVAGWLASVAAALFVAWLAVSAIIEHFTTAPIENPAQTE